MTANKSLQVIFDPLPIFAAGKTGIASNAPQAFGSEKTPFAQSIQIQSNMKIYRGPKTKPFVDDTHELVAKVSPEELEKGVREKARMTFNISKDGVLREAVCTAIFEDSDLVPVANGLLARLALQQTCIAKVQKIVGDKATTNDEKIQKISTALAKLR